MKPTDIQEPQPERSGKKLLVAVLSGLVALLVSIALISYLLPPQNIKADTTRIYDYLYSGVKSESVAFTTTNMSEDGILTFGSSELYISMPLVNQVPQKVFGESVSGLNLTYVGEAYDQSLWQAIAAGAYAGSVSNKKVVLMLSPQWFFKRSGQQSKFSSKFSYSLYKGFLNNENISDETKDYVRDRITELGVSSEQIQAANCDTFLDSVNDVLYQFSNDLRIRSKIQSLINGSPKKSQPRTDGTSTGEPNWDTLLEEAQSQGEQSCTNNSYGIYDSYWNKNSQFKSEQGQNFDNAENEWSDFGCFLQVCEEAGLEPLVVILPMHGSWYDSLGVTAETRAEFYDRAIDVCSQYGVAYADFSSCEYEQYFLCDTVHPGWIGWVRIEHAIYDFSRNRDNQFLGGSHFGIAEGLAEENTEIDD